MPISAPDRSATVWSSTFIPSKSPFSDFGVDGYSVAWVDTAAGRFQVLVDGARPAPGTAGEIVARVLDDHQVELFVAGSR